MSAQSSLRPTWQKGGNGRGFQPPPTASDRGDKGRSSSWGSQGSRDGNKFSALLDDDDDVPPVNSGGNGKSEEKPSGNARSEAFRSSFSRGTSASNRGSGRSLADLAARVPENTSSGRRPSRFSGLRSGDQGGSSGASGSIDSYKPDPSVVRYTREKLLSMRPPSNQGSQTLPPNLVHLEGSTILSKAPQDPVCWDTFDGEAIWESIRAARKSAAGEKVAAGSSRNSAETSDEPRRRNAGSSSGRWARGVALPPSDERKHKGDASNPNELWDDPIGGATGAASDFSAFGAMPDDGDAFDFDKMAEASKEFEKELHGTDDDNHQAKKVDLSRPLASAGMTLTSGSGDNVNVFEDFDDPAANDDAAAVRGGDEDPSASSRLMKMIGVTKDPSANDKETANPWGTSGNEGSNGKGLDSMMSLGGGSLSLNPWGGPDVFAAEQKAREEQAAAAEAQKRAQEAEILRRRQEEETQRRAMAQRQAEEQARHQQAAAMQQRQQQATNQQSQVELVLMERICQILENSWGRSDLTSILSTLHSEDSRVIPLLSNVDALRALIGRSPQRIALQRDPNFGGDIAVLSLTNAQWQQQQQARLQQEEIQRRRMEEEAAARKQAQTAASLNPDAPWFYSDPQNNIQGPFRGEEMRQWLEAGYFKGDLPISQQPSGPFVPLSVLFPDLSMAFRVVADNGAKEEAEAAKAAAEEEERRKLAAEEERRALEAKAEEEARQNAERIEKERKAAEAAAAAANGGNKSSNQLKMMLGLSSAPAQAEPSEDKESTNKAQMPAKRTTKANKKAQSKPVVVEEAPAPVPAQEKPAKASPAWGGAANAKPKKTMAEIQQEEARAAALMAAQKPRQSSSGWANVAATGKSGWSSGTVTATQAAAMPNASAVANARQAQGRARAPAPSTATRQTAAITQQDRGSSTASTSTPAEEFGASMSPALEKWCKEKMQKINGSDDLTLIAFCMTLNDANEIRQYLTTYLGATSQVNNFATEFINKRGLGSKQEEWATLGSPKKGRKKKAGR